MRASYRAKGPNFRAKLYSQGRMDRKALDYYDKRRREYLQQYTALAKKRDEILKKIDSLNDTVNKIDADMKATLKKADKVMDGYSRADVKSSKKFFSKGYKTNKNVLTAEFNDFELDYMSPYSKGSTSQIRREVADRERRRKRK